MTYALFTLRRLQVTYTEVCKWRTGKRAVPKMLLPKHQELNADPENQCKNP